MGQLQVVDITWVPALGNGDDVVDARRQRMRIFVGEIHRLATYTAHRLGGVDLLLVTLKSQAVGAILVGPVLVLGHRGTPWRKGERGNKKTRRGGRVNKNRESPAAHRTDAFCQMCVAISRLPGSGAQNGIAHLGTGRGTWTHGTRFCRSLLYQLSYARTTNAGISAGADPYTGRRLGTLDLYP